LRETTQAERQAPAPIADGGEDVYGVRRAAGGGNEQLIFGIALVRVFAVVVFGGHLEDGG